MSLFSKIEDLANESDVEQKFILPILTSDYPIGLGYATSDFRTKEDIRKISIGKGGEKKLYHPDYVILLNGIPMIVIEAKNPSEDLNEAIREARLYATEINSNFPNKINPCSKIIACNGENTICCYWDQQEPIIEIEFDDINSSSHKYEQLIEFASKRSNLKIWDSISEKIRGNRKYDRPINLLGGKEIREEEYSNNSFGDELVAKYRKIFNPDTYIDKKIIAEKAYIESQNLKSHQKSIDRIIRAAKPASITNSTCIKKTDFPAEIFNVLKDHNKCKGQIMLLIGNVGSGKSIFTVHTREVSLPAELKEKTLWLSLDLNNAPSSNKELYKWIKEKIVEEIRDAHSDVDFDDINFIKKIYGSELSKIKSKLEGLDCEDKFINEEIGKKFLDLEKDLDYNVKSYLNYFCWNRNRLPIITLDNCDKRSRDTQLLMFEVANWAKSEYGCLIFLPMRDITYDHHKKEPPLDTVVKDLIFRIEPPPLQEVLYQRVKFAIGSCPDPLIINCNGKKVTFQNEDQNSFFKTILKSLFSNQLFKRMVLGLAGRDIRKGIEIFLDFCKSGYIRESEYVQIIHLKGEYLFKPYLIMRVLLRGSRKYYIDENSNIKNLFKCFPNDKIPDPYLRLSILQWLKINFAAKGPNNTRGYHKIQKLRADLIALGHEEERINEELISLIRSRNIITESLIVNENNELIFEKIDSEELICIAPAGHVHLELLNNVEYLASCSEDIWYRDAVVAERIRDRIARAYSGPFLAPDNAEDLINYLEQYKQFFTFKPEIYLQDDVLLNLTDLSICSKAIKTMRDSLPTFNKTYQTDEKLSGKVFRIVRGGYLVKITDAMGFLPGNREFNLSYGQEIDVKIIKFDENHQRYLLKLP